ncbi:MAG: biosynthetic-type acetolactate synthase large subunit [Mahellales bacterium]
MRMTGAQAIIKSLEQNDVKVVFGYPGGAILPLYDSLLDSPIKHVLVRQEQAAAHEASGYARITGKVGVCIATSGPGATNLITGIATAYMDSIPIVAITGQVPVEMIGRDVFQEIDITGATEPFCKHNYLVKEAADIPRIIAEAFYIASTGRPGPVLVDVPKDVAMEEIDYHYPDRIELRGYKPTYNGHPLQIKRVAKAIEKCQRPVICAGGGAITSNAADEIALLSQRIEAPVATTLMGIGSFPGDHPLSLGMLGQHGSYAANKAVAEADLLIVVGARLGDRATGSIDNFAANAIIVHIDIDPAEIGKNVNTNIPIVGDVKYTMGKLLDYDLKRMDSSWLEDVRAWKDKYRHSNLYNPSLKPAYILTRLSDKVDKEKTILVTDVGQHQIWAGNYYTVKRPRTFLTSGGLGTMGYGLPAAIGAKLADGDNEVILVTGDGSLQMSLQELALLKQESLVVKILLFNNNALGMVRELQQQHFNSRYSQVHLTGNPDFCKLAQAYGLPALKVDREEEVDRAIDMLIDSKTSVLVEFKTEVNEKTSPYGVWD